MASASAAHPELVPSLASCPTEGNPLYAITLHPRGVSARALTVYVHPLTGQVLGQVDENASWIGFVESFHVDLLMKHNGRSWNGIGASSLLLLVLSGLVLWWPGIRHWRRAFKVDLRRTWKRMNWDLHSAVAIWTLGFTLIWAVTGIYFAWEAPFERMINAVSPITTASYPAAEMNRIAARPVSVSTQTFDPKMVLDDAVRRSPGAALEGIFFGAEPNAVFTVYMARERVGDYASTDFLYFDQQTNEWLYTWHRGVNHTAGDWMLWLFVPLHFGTSWGLAGKIAWCAFGLALPVLATTGLLMYWNRWLGKALKRTASRAS